MPIYENACRNGSCPVYGAAFEWYAHSHDKPDPVCEMCGTTTGRMISTFSVVWAAPMSKYDNKGSQQQRATDAHVAWRINSSRRPDGKPEKVIIDSISKQREYCRDEGLRNPTDINPNSSVSSDGRKLYTSGMPGQWY